MGRSCTICQSPERMALEALFGEYVSLAELARQTGFRKSALARHRQHTGHLPVTRSRGQICTVCQHRERPAIELQLRLQLKFSHLARQFALSRDALRRHRQFHLQSPISSQLPTLSESGEWLDVSETNRAPAEADLLETEQTAQVVTPADYEAVLSYWRNHTWLPAIRETLLEHAAQLSEAQVDMVLVQAIQQGELTAYREFYIPADALVRRLRPVPPTRRPTILTRPSWRTR
jgi:hypothetical protein